MEQINYNTLPEAVARLLDKVSNIERIVQQTTEPTPEGDQLLTVPQAAEFLTLAVPTVYSMVSRGELPYMKPKGTKRLYFSRQELTEYLKTGRRKTTAEVQAEAGDSFKKERGNR